VGSIVVLLVVGETHSTQNREPKGMWVRVPPWLIFVIGTGVHRGEPMSDRLHYSQILDVTHWLAVNDEPMGTKPKFWLRTESGEDWLFKKKHRLHSDDDCTEKIASELAVLFGLPHATVELAQRNGERGIVTRDIVAECEAEALIHGNSLLVEVDPEYPSGDFYHVANHTIDRIFSVFAARCVGLPPGTEARTELADGRDLFTGYLLFDAWIGNTDRHHENWAVLKFAVDRFVLAPSYDHASSLGHNLQDSERADRLVSKDRNRTVEAYAAKARSALFRSEADKKPASTDEAFALATVSCRKAGRYWLNRLREISDDAATDIVNRVPDGLLSPHGKRFAVQLLRANRARLLKATI